MNRYQVECFKASNARRVPYEQLDYNIYKATANLVAFSTSEKRIPLWVKAMKLRYQYGFENNTWVMATWEEQDSTCERSKCDKVTINIVSLNDKRNLLTITISISTG